MPRRAVSSQEVARLYEQGLTQSQIAFQCGVSQPTVARRLAAIAPVRVRHPRPPALPDIPPGVDPEDRRKLVYVRDQLASGRRSERDASFLVGVYRDVLRRAGATERCQRGPEK